MCVSVYSLVTHVLCNSDVTLTREYSNLNQRATPQTTLYTRMHACTTTEANLPFLHIYRHRANNLFTRRGHPSRARARHQTAPGGGGVPQKRINARI